MHFIAAETAQLMNTPDPSTEQMSIEVWNRQVDEFDVDGLAQQLAEIKAGYFFLTLGQNSGYFCSPNATLDSLVGRNSQTSRCSRRDLVADLYQALEKYDIPLMVYLPSHAPMDDMEATIALKCIPPWDFSCWSPPTTDNITAFQDPDPRIKTFQRNWENMIREWSERWKQNVRGWWFDGCYYVDKMYNHPDEPNFKSFKAAVRAGNPESLVAWNYGVYHPVVVTDKEEDYTAGEVNDPSLVESPGSRLQNDQFHILSFLGTSWGCKPLRFSKDELIAYTRNITDMDGVFTWDTPFTINGHIRDDAFELFKALGAAIEDSKKNPRRSAVVESSVPDGPVAVNGKTEVLSSIIANLKNPWDANVDGNVRITSDFLDFVGDSTINYSLKPGETRQCELPVKVKADIPFNFQYSVYKDNASFPTKHQFPLKWYIEPAHLPSDTALSDIKISAIQSWPLYSSKGVPFAKARFLSTAENLDILMSVKDSLMKRNSNAPWEGSCIELFFAADENSKVVHLLVLPETEDEPASLLRKKETGGWENMDGNIDFSVNTTRNGYEARMRFPILWLIGEKADSLLLEVGVTAGVDNVFARGRRLFGSTHAYMSPDGFAMCKLNA